MLIIARFFRESLNIILYITKIEKLNKIASLIQFNLL